MLQLYCKSIMGGAGEVGVFGRTQTQALDLQGRTTTASMAGAKVISPRGFLLLIDQRLTRSNIG
jgi:hypothetical protein